MTDETETLASHYVTEFGDTAGTRIADDIAWAMTTQAWEEAQRLQRVQQRMQALHQHEQAIRQAADLADQPTRFVPGLSVRSLDSTNANLLRLTAA